MLPVKKLLALARGNAGLQADEVKVVVDELDSRIKELEADRHPCINVMSERIEELERERDELKEQYRDALGCIAVTVIRAHDVAREIADKYKDEQLHGKLIEGTQQWYEKGKVWVAGYVEAQVKLTEANALLRECRELLSCYQGAAEMILDCDKYKLVAGHTGALKGLNKARTDTDCRLAAHLKKGDTDGG